MDSMLSTTMVSFVTTDLLHVDELNMLNIEDRNEFISLIRLNFGATSLSPHCGLKPIRKVHGKYQDTMRCLGCQNFNLRINGNKYSWCIYSLRPEDRDKDRIINNF